VKVTSHLDTLKVVWSDSPLVILLHSTAESNFPASSILRSSLVLKTFTQASKTYIQRLLSFWSSVVRLEPSLKSVGRSREHVLGGRSRKHVLVVLLDKDIGRNVRSGLDIASQRR